MSADPVPYTDLLIRIRGPRPGSTAPSVEAVVDHDSLFYGGTLALDEQQLLAAEADNQAYGQILMKALFSEPIQRAYDRASAKAGIRSGGQLRIRLQIDDDVAGLQALRWERATQLFDGQPAPLATAARTPFSRFTGLEGDSAAPLALRPVAMAFCISNPTPLPDGFVAVDVEGEVRNIQKTIGSLRQNYPVQVTLAAGRTGLSKDLRDSLVADGYTLLDGALTLDVLVSQMLTANVVHYLGHGVFRPDATTGSGTAALYLEDAAGGLSVTRDDDLLPRLSGAAHLPHLVVLMACEGARRAGVQPNVGLAAKLVQAGIPAVFAMQTKLPVEDATELTRRFYASLLDDGNVDLAANTARSYLYGARKSDYSIPALFMRLQTGQLLAPDPALAALKNILAETADTARKPKLPIDVVIATGRPGQAELERLAATGEPSVDRLDATLAAFPERDRPAPAFVVIVGNQGAAKTTHLRRVAYVSAEASITSHDRIVPIYVDLGEFPNVTRTLGDPFTEFLAGCMRRSWPGLATDQFTTMLAPSSPVTFRFLIDGDDQLSDQQRADVYRHVVRFAQRNRSRQYLIASDSCNSEDLLRMAEGLVTRILVIKPIRQSRAEEYLAALGEPAARDLEERLQDKKLFDLARQPWLLARMLEQARVGVLPTSRAAVLNRVVDEQIARIATGRGMKARALEALKALAWNMNSRRHDSLPLAEAFPVIETVRGNRGFAAEDLFDQLVEQRLLARIGQDRLRFAYPAILAYCSAQALASMPEAERNAAVDDITASLGRLTRHRWWDETLIVLSGLLPNTGASRLIRSVIYGSRFSEGERAILAARCIQECQTADQDVRAQVVDALIWRSKIANEARSTARVRAIEALAGIQAEAAIPHLASLAVDRVRKNFVGQDDFEYSNVRLAATLALMRMNDPAGRYLWKERPAVARTLELWRAGKVEELGRLLTAAAASPSPPPQDELSASIAAFALGQMRSPRAAELLVAGFQNPDLPRDTRWCVTDTLETLQSVDPTMICDKILLPFFAETDGGNQPPETMKDEQYRYDQIAYLAGRIKSRDDKTLTFLDNSLSKWTRVSLKGRAIKAIAVIYTPADGERFEHYKQCFEQLAVGDLSSVPMTQPADPADITYLQRCALEALGSMGDLATLAFLREKRGNWTNEVDGQFFATSEEIYLRMGTLGFGA